MTLFFAPCLASLHTQRRVLLSKEQKMFTKESSGKFKKRPSIFKIAIHESTKSTSLPCIVDLEVVIRFPKSSLLPLHALVHMQIGTMWRKVSCLRKQHST